jgi:hypothetical protein
MRCGDSKVIPPAIYVALEKRPPSEHQLLHEQGPLQPLSMTSSPDMKNIHVMKRMLTSLCFVLSAKSCTEQQLDLLHAQSSGEDLLSLR